MESKGVRKLLGQFADKSFYLELLQTAIREVFKAAALAFAGSLSAHVQKKFQGPVVDYSPPNTQTAAASAASRAFGVTDTTNYSRPAYSPSMSTGAQSFPGFGR